MLTPSNCPICQYPLRNTPARTIGLPFWQKECFTSPGHLVRIYTVPGDDNTVDRFIFRLGKGYIVWDFSNQQCFIANDADMLPNGGMLAFFEPDFSNYSKLLAKINLYVLFS